MDIWSLSKDIEFTNPVSIFSRSLSQKLLANSEKSRNNKLNLDPRLFVDVNLSSSGGEINGSGLGQRST